MNPEFEMRVPLLQGAGAELNRIAGPSKTPGLLGGVLLARVNWRGMGQTLIDPNWGKPRFDNAYQTLMSGDFQEWQLVAGRPGFLSVSTGHNQLRSLAKKDELRPLAGTGDKGPCLTDRHSVSESTAAAKNERCD